MTTAIVLDKKRIYEAAVDPATTAEIDETFAAAGDLVYVVDSIRIPVVVATATDICVIQITDASDVVQASFTPSTTLAIAAGGQEFTLESGGKGDYTDGGGNEHIQIPENFVIRGGWKLKSVSENTGNTSFGKFQVYGHMAKLL